MEQPKTKAAASEGQREPGECIDRERIRGGIAQVNRPESHHLE
jgi:hypothetical protein